MKHHWYTSLLALTVLPAVSAATTPTSTKTFEPLARNFFVTDLAQPNAASNTAAVAVEDEIKPLEFDVYWNDTLNFRTKDKQFKLKVGGRIHHDSVWFSEDIEKKSSDFDFENGTEFRRTRLYLKGSLRKDIDFKIQIS